MTVDCPARANMEYMSGSSLHARPAAPEAREAREAPKESFEARKISSFHGALMVKMEPRSSFVS